MEPVEHWECKHAEAGEANRMMQANPAWEPIGGYAVKDNDPFLMVDKLKLVTILRRRVSTVAPEVSASAPASAA